MRKHWKTISPKTYLEHLEELNLGPNVVALMPHSMLRIDAMGFDNSISRDPNDSELKTMQAKLSDALKLGYAGFSTDALPFHYLANQPNCEKTIPTQFAKYGEIKKLTQVVRDHGAVWQATPPKDSAINTIKTFLLTSGRLHKKPLRTTVVAALDVANNWRLLRLAKLLAKILNSKFIQGDFHLQALGAPFKVWSDGAVTPLSEEIPELRRLNETNLEDRQARLTILNDPEYISAFRSMWLKGKQGWGLAKLKRRLNIEDYAFNRKLSDMTVERCPIDHWVGLNMQYVQDRILDIKRGNIPSDISQQELSIITANRNPDTIRELLMNPLLMPGFNDCGAHLTNMAFYDVNLRSLKLASSGGDKDISYIVKRLTKDAADLFGVKAGTINEGDVADLILIDPKQLANYDGEANVIRQHRNEYNHEQLVNRSDGVVPLVMIGGNIAWENDAFSTELETKPMGRLLRASAA